ncbi:hypothetical protein V8F06_003857 [Rhypophila decipiens]
MSERPSWMPKAPRIFLLAIFPVITFILYCQSSLSSTAVYPTCSHVVLVILELGCINNTMSVVSPIIVRSNGSVPIGAQTTAPVDLRIGFWGLCFGPQPLSCTSSVNIFKSKSVSQLSRAIPASKGGGNIALARLALGLQANFAILSGIVLFILIVLDLAANLVQIYFNAREEWEYQMQAAVWARSLDWATAAGSIGAFSSYRALLVATPDLLRATSQTGGTTTTMMMMASISAGTVAFNLFAAIVGISVVGAVVNTLLTMSEVGAAVRTRGEVFKRPAGGIDKASIIRTQIVLDGGGSKVDVLKPGYVPVYKRRPAYEVFP